MESVVDDHDLVASSRVEGTPVFDRRAVKIGSIRSLMISKTTGVVSHAVLSFGGIFGVGARACPLAWDQLRFDAGLGGYLLPYTREEIEAVPYMVVDPKDRPHETPEPVYRHWDQFL